MQVIHPYNFASDDLYFMALKKTHGGKRKGAGRPKLPKSKLKEKTKVMRVPVSLVETVQELIDRYNESKQ